MDLREATLPTEGNPSRRHPWELARYRVVQDWLTAWLGPAQPAGQVVLDMGCGDSWFIERLAREGAQHRYLGVDIAFSGQQLTRLRQRVQGHPISLHTSLDEATAQLAGRGVNVVLLLDVIEHIEDEVGFLRWMQTFPAMTPQTAFVITVPAFQGLFCAHDEFLLHHRRYQRHALRQALGQAGLRVAESGYFFGSLLLPRLLQVALERSGLYRPDPSGVGQWAGGASATQAVAQVLWQDYRLGRALRRQGLHLPGLSTFAIAYPHADTP